MTGPPTVGWDDPRVLASPIPAITRDYLMAVARLKVGLPSRGSGPRRRWAIRCNHEDGTSHVGQPGWTDDEIAEALQAANADAHGKTYTAETAGGMQWPEERA